MKKPPISQNGIKGFLIWFHREQPALFAKIAPQLPAKVPKAFSNYTSAQNRLRTIYRTGVLRRSPNSLAGFSDYDTLPEIDVSAPSLAMPVTVNYTNSLTPVTVDYSSSLASTPSGDYYGTNTPMPTLPPVAAAANTGSSSTPIANAIAQTVGAVSSVYLTNQQAALQQQVIASQLARAQAGLPPLNTSLNELGVPTVGSTGTGFSTSGIMLLGLAAAVALALTDKK